MKSCQFHLVYHQHGAKRACRTLGSDKDGSAELFPSFFLDKSAMRPDGSGCLVTLGPVWYGTIWMDNIIIVSLLSIYHYCSI